MKVQSFLSAKGHLSNDKRKKNVPEKGCFGQPKFRTKIKIDSTLYGYLL